MTVEQACLDALAAIDAEPDPGEAFAMATELATLLQAAHHGAALRRARAARRIWEAEKLSLAGLADRIGVSKARADQLVNKERPKGQTP